MKKLFIAAVAVASTTAFAGGFDGPFVQLGIGGAGTSSKVSGSNIVNDDTGATLTSLDGTHSQGSFNGLVSAGYSQSIGSAGFNLGANLFYLIGNQNAGNATSNWSQAGYSLSQNGSLKLENTWGISVEPGWNFTESTLGFVKLAWVNSSYKSNLGYSFTTPNNSYDDSASASGSKNINGFGYGIGVKQMLTSNIYAGIDVMGVSYQSWSSDGVSARPTQWMGFASVGYKF